MKLVDTFLIVFEVCLKNIQLHLDLGCELDSITRILVKKAFRYLGRGNTDFILLQNKLLTITYGK